MEVKVVIALICFGIGLVFPRPSARVEAALYPVGEAEHVLIGSSIIDHVEPTGSVNLRQLATDRGFGVAARAGLTPEEALFIKSSLGSRKYIQVLGLYALLAPESYNVGKHLYYTGSLGGRAVQQELWRYDHNVLTEEAYREVKEKINEKLSHGGAYIFDEIDYLHSKYSYWGSLEESSGLIKRNAQRLLASGSFLILIVPSASQVGVETYQYVNQIRELLVSQDKEGKISFIEVPNHELAEPWCLCGHLNSFGVKRLAALIWE